MCFLLSAEKLICNSRTVRVEMCGVDEDESYRIVNHGPMLTPKTFALTPSKEKWKMKVKSFGDVTPASSGVKKKRGRPSKSSVSANPPVSSPSFTPSVIGIMRKESPDKVADPPDATVIPLHKKRGRPSKKSFSPQKSVQPTVISVQKKRGRPSKNSAVTQEEPDVQVCCNQALLLIKYRDIHLKRM